MCTIIRVLLVVLALLSSCAAWPAASMVFSTPRKNRRLDAAHSQTSLKIQGFCVSLSSRTVLKPLKWQPVDLSRISASTTVRNKWRCFFGCYWRYESLRRKSRHFWAKFTLYAWFVWYSVPAWGRALRCAVFGAFSFYSTSRYLELTRFKNTHRKACVR